MFDHNVWSRNVSLHRTMETHHPTSTVRRIPSINEKANAHAKRVKDEIEDVRKQIRLQKDQLEELERGQASLLERLKHVEHSPLEDQAMDAAQRLSDTKKTCKAVMKEVVKLDESMQRRRKEMTVLWKKIQNQVHLGAEAQSTLRKRCGNNNAEATSKEKEVKEKEAQVHQRWQRRLSL